MFIGTVDLYRQCIEVLHEECCTFPIRSIVVNPFLRQTKCRVDKENRCCPEAHVFICIQCQNAKKSHG